MKREEIPTRDPAVDSSAARAHVIRWLGDCYLPASPIHASRKGPRPPALGIE